MHAEVKLPYKYRFDAFELSPQRRILERSAQRIVIPPKALELLICLVERAGQTVSKEQLFAELWNGAVVEENNLTQYISALRKALGERRGENRYIVTDPGRGYRFVAPVSKILESAPADSATPLNHDMEQFVQPAKRRSRVKVWWYGVAAAVLIMLGLGVERLAALMPSGDPGTAEAEVRWARSRVGLGQAAEAIKQVKAALPVARATLPPDSVRLWDILHNAVHTLNEAKDYRDADSVIQEALEVTRRMNLPPTSDRWGMLYWDEGRSKRGEKSYDQALAAFDKAVVNFSQFPDQRTAQVHADIEITKKERDAAVSRARSQN